MTNEPQNQQDINIVDKFIEFAKQSFKLTFKYFWSKTLASIILGCIAFGVLKLINIDNALSQSIVIGFFNLIPVVGGLISCIICGIIALFQSPISALYVVIAILVLQQIDQWILTPLIVGNSVKLPPILIIIALFAGSWLWGPVGIIVAVPIAAMIKLFYSMFIKSKKIPDVIEVEAQEINEEDIKTHKTDN